MVCMMHRKLTHLCQYWKIVNKQGLCLTTLQPPPADLCYTPLLFDELLITPFYKGANTLSRSRMAGGNFLLTFIFLILLSGELTMTYWSIIYSFVLSIARHIENIVRTYHYINGICNLYWLIFKGFNASEQ